MDGKFQAYRMHERCSKLANELYGYGDWNGHDAMEFRAALAESEHDDSDLIT